MENIQNRPQTERSLTKCLLVIFGKNGYDDDYKMSINSKILPIVSVVLAIPYHSEALTILLVPRSLLSHSLEQHLSNILVSGPLCTSKIRTLKTICLRALSGNCGFCSFILQQNSINSGFLKVGSKVESESMSINFHILLH